MMNQDNNNQADPTQVNSAGLAPESMVSSNNNIQGGGLGAAQSGGGMAAMNNNMGNPQQQMQQQQQGGIDPNVLANMQQQQQQQQQALFPQAMINQGNPNFNHMAAMQQANASAPGANNAAAPAQANNNQAVNQSNLLFAHLMQNPLAVQMMAQGINPMVLLMGGGNQLVNPNPVASNNFSAPGVPQARPDDGALKNATARMRRSNKKLKVKGKPKRPLSAYNFFFREERENILTELPPGIKKKDGDDEENEDEKKAEDAKKKGDDTVKKESEEGAEGEDGKDWDQKDKTGKKIPHGKIGFESLAKEIGKRWQELEETDPERMAKYKKLADEDMARYKTAMDVWSSKDRFHDGELMAVQPMYSSVVSLKRKGDGEEEKPKKKSKKVKVDGDSVSL